MTHFPLISCDICTHGLQFLQSFRFTGGAAEAAGAGWRTGDVRPAAAALFQLDERPVEESEGNLIIYKIPNLLSLPLAIFPLQTLDGCWDDWDWSCLSLLGQISGELGLDDVSDLTSWDSGQISAGFWSLQTKAHINQQQRDDSWTPATCMKTQTHVLNTNLRVCLSIGVSVLEWRRGKRPERRFTGLFRGDLADNTGGWRSQVIQLGLSLSQKTCNS